MKRLNMILIITTVMVLGAATSAWADNLTPVPTAPAEYQDASATVHITVNKYNEWQYDWWTGERIRVTRYEWWATISYSGLQARTDYWLSGTTTTGERIWLAGFMSDTGDHQGTNGGLYSGPLPRFAYFELWSDSTPDPFYLGEPVQVLLSSQRLRR